MTKTMLIEYQEGDENILLEIFKRFNVRNRSKNIDEPIPSAEQVWVQKQLMKVY